MIAHPTHSPIGPDVIHHPTGVLLSGGLDSAILVASLLEQGHCVQPFYVQSHLWWQHAEFPAARRFLAALAPNDRLRPLVVLDLPLGDLYHGHWSLTGVGIPTATCDDESVFLPGRNALLVIKAALWCRMHGIPRLALAALGTSPFPDARRDYFVPFERVVNCGDGVDVRIALPFETLDKQQVMRLARHAPIQWTFSCLAPVEGLHCGQCNKCHERRRAFDGVDRTDPTQYATRVSPCSE